MKISPQTLEIVQTLRDCVRADDGSCQELLQCLTDMPEFEGASVTAGFFVTRDGKIKDGYAWLALPDESCFDPSQDEFGEDGFGDVVHVSKKDPRYQHYFPYTGKPGIPMNVLNFADRIQAKHRNRRNRSFIEMIQEEPEVIPQSAKWISLDQVLEASSASPSSDVARQSSTDLPDYMTAGGHEGMPQDDKDEEFKPEEFENTLRKHLTDDYDDYEPQMYVIEPGTMVYHGTSSTDWDERNEYPDVPFWVSENITDVEFFVTWHGNPGNARIITFRTTKPLHLVLFNDRDDMDLFSEYTGIDMDFPGEAAEDICAKGLSGWIVPGNYKNGGSDIMVCDADALEYIETDKKQITMDDLSDGENPDDLSLIDLDDDLKEVDHPEYMPGGDETRGYDPNYDPAHQERQSGYNTGHPKP